MKRATAGRSRGRKGRGARHRPDWGHVSPKPQPDEGRRPFHPKGLKEIDWDFVDFLGDYASRDLECPPRFRAFLLDVVLQPHKVPGLELPEQVEYFLRNPCIRDFNPGPNFHERFREYALYSQVFPEPGTPFLDLPYVPIPEEYLPFGPLRLSENVNTTLPVIPEEDSETQAEVEDDKQQHQRPAEDERMAPGDPREEEEWAGPMSDGPRTSEGTGRERVSGAESPAATPGRLSSRAPSLGSDLATPQVLAFLDQEELRTRTGPDWEVDSWYKGVRQPPLAARLDTICKFLADEDVDRCIGWAVQFPAVLAYLEWLAHEDESQQLHNASPETKALYLDAVQKAEAHILFEKHHYSPTTIEFNPVPKFPLRSSRLNSLVDGQARRAPLSASAADRRCLLPKRATPRPIGPVNAMPNTSAARRGYDDFLENVESWWKPVAGPKPSRIPSKTEAREDKQNLVYIDDHKFREVVRNGFRSRIQADPETGDGILHDDDDAAPAPSGSQGWASARGACRAGLQQGLRALASKPPLEPDAPRRHLIFPLPAAALRKAVQQADGVQWIPPSVDLKRFAGSLEPLAWTVWYRDRLRIIRDRRARAFAQVTEAHRDDASWTPLPLGVVTGGPFAWRKLGRRQAASQDARKSALSTYRLLKAAYQKEPRDLLRDVLDVLRRAMSGEFDDGRLPPGVALADDEWVASGGAKVPCWPDAWEVRFLEFLATESASRKSLHGRFLPDTPKDKYRLFQLFARKVKKLLDDRNPEGLFSKHDAVVTVEELLEALHAGKDSSAVAKHEFPPHDACAWLDRLAATGHVRFTLDMSCYGIVRRPVADYFPEHRVHWPVAGVENRSRPYYGPAFIAPWSRIAKHGAPPTARGSNIWNFFVSIAFRLGLAYASVLKEEASGASPLAASPARRLRASLDEFRAALAALPGENPELAAEELASARAAILRELAANDSMPAPARRAKAYRAETGEAVDVLVRDVHWDWASPRARGDAERRRRRYWSVNRWPAGVGYLTERAERAVREDEDLDPRATADPAAADPTTDWWYTRPKLKPYGLDRTQYRRGPAVFPIGDTRLQREVIKEMITQKVAAALGMPPEEPTWRDKLAELNPFKRPKPASLIGPSRLPSVDPKLVPVSVDPEGQAPTRGLRSIRDVGAEKDDGSDDDVDDDDDQGARRQGIQVEAPDVAMTGMS
ncbi:hypothetical protein VTJ83DRAFT_426 [Remersonia thermophila]|uniref:Uncharacterized protein n=1 Tax=Remersonia thermophila TaxID=72144 RepID=A0ABR4DKX6_9PEZI